MIIYINLYVAPSGKPTNIHVDPIDENTLKVMWKAPERSDWNGEIQGYYVGYKQSSLVDNKFVFETVEFSKEEGKEHYLEIFNLKYVNSHRILFLYYIIMYLFIYFY